MINENNTTNEAQPSTQLETVTCSRCGGSGHYSYCQMYGTTCFKCHGRGKVYTKRGQAAADFFNRLLSKTTLELVPGVDKVKSDNPLTGASKWVLVTEVYLQTAERTGGAWSLDKDGNAVYSGYVVEASGHGFISEPADKVWRVASTAEQKQAAMKQALAYQDTLTKQGKPRKR